MRRSRRRPGADPHWLVQRWQREVTLHEVPYHLGVETRRQWSEAAIRRSFQMLLGLFSLVALLAHERMANLAITIRQATW